MCSANLKQGDTDTSASTGTLGAKAISVPQIQALPERGEGGVDVMVHSEISHRSRPKPDAADVRSYAAMRAQCPNNLKNLQTYIAGTSRRIARTAERYRALSTTDFDHIIHVGIPLGKNVRTESSFAESAALPKIDNIKGRGFLQKGFLLRFQRPDSADSKAILIRYEWLSARLRPTPHSRG